MDSNNVLRRIWIISFLYGLLFYSLGLIYLYFLTDINPISNQFLYLSNRALGISSVLMIGTCFLILPLSKVFEYFKNKIVYRKYFGLVGFFIALIHSVISLYIYPLDLFLGPRLVPFIFGLLGLLILIIDALISSNEAYQKLGFFWWKMILRLAYFSYILIAVHIGYGQRAVIFNYFETGGLPPTGLLLLIFITLVLVARLVVLIYDFRKVEVKLHGE